MDMAVTFVSWNIQKGFGMDLRRDLARTADVLAALEPDVVGLQEVVRARGMDQAEVLARRLGMQLVWGEARKARDGSYGNLLLVRGVVEASRVHELTVPGHEARCCLEAQLSLGGMEVRVLVCHFGLGFRERRRQMTRATGIFRASLPDRPRVVMGDFNEWHRGPVSRGLAAEFPRARAPQRSHPSPLPLLSLDRLVWDATLQGALEVLPVRMASDHRLLRAKLTPKDPRPWLGAASRAK
jgi:endonuclease/exonuclease/phosphatase family metal-dependent hydrolase